MKVYLSQELDGVTSTITTLYLLVEVYLRIADSDVVGRVIGNGSRWEGLTSAKKTNQFSALNKNIFLYVCISITVQSILDPVDFHR